MYVKVKVLFFILISIENVFRMEMRQMMIMIANYIHETITEQLSFGSVYLMEKLELCLTFPKQ